MIWFVAVGSAVGGMSRYLVQALVQRSAGTVLPIGTMAVNVTGSFLLGLIAWYAADSSALSPEVRTLLTVGFCGGYTTFSTFSYETIVMLRDGEPAAAALYVIASVALSMIAVVAGFLVARLLIGARAG
jgi:CrcB protein